MYPVLVDWGVVYIPSWHFFYVLGALAAYKLLIILAKKYDPSISQDFLSKLFVICYISGYFGSRLLSIFIEESAIFDTSNTFQELILKFGERLISFGPMTFYGGAILASLSGCVYIVYKKQHLPRVLDLAFPAGFIGLFFGRIGCFLNGDDYGKPIDPLFDGSIPFWAIKIPGLGEDIYRWPIQLIEGLSVLFLVLIVLLFFRRIRSVWGYGSVGFLTIIGYANIRLFTEFFRDDFRGYVFFSWLSTSQFISIVILMLGSIFGLYSTVRRT
jgi:phosphatidylglycerol:prolipoprotein diacylglycerol transferase